MYEHQLDPKQKDKKWTPRRLESTGSPAADLEMVQRPGLPAAGQFLLALQGRYGNRHVQRVVDAARPGHSLGAICADGSAPPIILRQEAPEEEEEIQMEADRSRVGPEGGPVSPDVESAINRARGGGQPLDAGIQAQMGEALGHDFSDVRVHTGAEADTLSQQLSARAFTTGRDIFFRNGAYDPASSRGRDLLAHELSHVVQQSSGKVNRSRGKMMIRPAGDAFEREADTLTRKVITYGCSMLAGLKSPRTLEMQTAVTNGSTKGLANNSTTRELIQRDFDEDLARITVLRNSAPDGSVYRNILTEAINSAARVRDWASVVSSGNAERRFTAGGDVAGYILKYQVEAQDATQRIANFVHELTHISVQEAYHSDFVNYANPADHDVVAPVYGTPDHHPKFGQVVTGLRNEEQRQGNRMNAAVIEILGGNLAALAELVDSSGLTQEQKNQINNQITYGRIRPHIEYDTVVNQIYLWCKGWNANTNTRFFQMLEAMVDDAYNRRRNQRQVENQVPVPTRIEVLWRSIFGSR